ncbi:PREDICTED: gamma-aminobutyric acid type B receptor subunit 2-like [Amphimedon queenslandica]|nr:PREDICTED: gamma-aminobutyric acid type B receptor subunit 2-like [Amphimedon queenslandica]|eukprot:XP_019855011.1 PREDICTED: gamma-aminobutyric acid type B receptor subunit 2-like [Amphimedon queenslandica]
MASNRPDLNNTRTVLSAVDDAVGFVNDNLLSDGVSLMHSTILTDCYNLSEAEQVVASLPQTSPPTVALLGGGCSLVTGHIANVTKIPIISYYSTSPSLNDSFPLLFTLRPSDSLIPPALARIFKEFGWSQVALATQTVSQYNKLHQILDEVFQSSDIDISQHSIFSYPLGSDLPGIDKFLESQSHIFFLNCDPKISLLILCQAYKKGLYYPNYMWITLGWYPPSWWDITPTDCSTSQLKRVLHRSFSISSIRSVSDDHSIESYVFDGVHALALAVNRTIEANKSIIDEGSALIQELPQVLKDLEFNGLTGKVDFKSKEDNSTVLIVQYRRDSSNDLMQTNVAYYDIRQSIFKYMNNTTATDVFPDGIPPDGTPIKIVNTVHIGITVIIITMQVIGFSMLIICLLFNILFRNRKIVKLNSPNLNYIIITGVTVMMVGLTFYYLPLQSKPALRVICTIRRICSTLGHFVAFTVALVKTWRVHYIFRSPSMKKKAPSDSKLFLVALVIVALESLLSIALLVPDVVYSPVGTTIDRERTSTVNEQGVSVMYCIADCGTTNFYLTWVVLTVIVSFISHAVAVTLAFRIRSIEVDAINDYKYTSAIVYTSTVLLILLVAVIFALNDYVNVFVFCVTLLVFGEGLVFLSLTFIPKMIALYKDPKGDKIFSHQTGIGAASCHVQSVDNGKDKITPLSPSTPAASHNAASDLSSENELNSIQPQTLTGQSSEMTAVPTRKRE